MGAIRSNLSTLVLFYDHYKLKMSVKNFGASIGRKTKAKFQN